MCGIFCYHSKSGKLDLKKLKECSSYIKHRGPDNTRDMVLSDRKTYFSFHRLAINGLGHDSDEPLHLILDDGREGWLMCNGEIYNHIELEKEYGLKMNTKNDCEVILHLYFLLGFEEMIKRLDGVFAIILYDVGTDQIWLGNDPIGIRPLYQGSSKSGDLAWASEPIALRDCIEKISFFPPGHLQLLGAEPISYFSYEWKIKDQLGIPEIHETYRRLLTESVRKRLMTERPIACLLSGGLDSSLISSLVARLLPEGEKLHTFSIGLEGSPDLRYARIVSEYIGSIHHEVVVEQDDFLKVIPDVIRAIQSYDITTVRASCGNYLIAKYISENTDFKVILNGDVSEEIHSSYFYSSFAPSDLAFFEDNVRLLLEVHRYDVLRSARCIEHFGLEARTPFADKDLVNFVMTIPPYLKRFGKDSMFIIEKALIREAFKGYLPEEVRMRPKTAFSDGVSKKEKSWHKIIQEHMETLVSDKELDESDFKTKESYYYYQIYSDLFSDRKDLREINGEFWMPRFIEASDPSARELQ